MSRSRGRPRPPENFDPYGRQPYDRDVTSAVEDPEGGWNLTLSCGHTVFTPVYDRQEKVRPCAQCVTEAVKQARA